MISNGNGDDPTAPLTPGARRIVARAQEAVAEFRHAGPGVNHWLLAVLERHGPMAADLAVAIDPAAISVWLVEQLKAGTTGPPLEEAGVVSAACEHARVRGKQAAAERDVVAVILSFAGYTLREGAIPAGPPPSDGPPAAETPASADAVATGEPGADTPPEPAYRPRAVHPTPTLDQFGRDLTREAQQRKLLPTVGREAETGLVMETLCRRTKRNPVLIGPAGVGKTAIVEGLACRVVAGDVPALLQGVRVICLQPSTLAAGASMAGEFEKRMQSLVEEARQDGIVVFIDEVHSLVGAGGRAGTSDAASVLKPALARGELACIAATTDDEYRVWIEPDSALERRFQPIRVQELTREQTLAVLRVLRDDFLATRRVMVPDAVLGWLIDSAERYLRNRYFPDKAVDLLEQAVACAVSAGRDAVDVTTARLVTERMVGVPVGAEAGREALREQLTRRRLLAAEHIEALLGHLAVALRGLDIRPTRPNVVALLLGDAATEGPALAETIAGCLFGSPERTVTIDLGRFTQAEDVTMLVGAPPGYVGYTDTLPIHRVAQMPWCVVTFENVEACHPQVLGVVVQALSDGFVTESRGRRIYLSDAVVLLTARTALAHHHAIGFADAARPAATAATDLRQAVADVLGEALVSECDLVCDARADNRQIDKEWVRTQLLDELSHRYRRQGLEVRWDDSAVEWILGQAKACDNRRDWERLIDERVAPLLIGCLPASADAAAKCVLVRGGESAAGGGLAAVDVG